jgi:hypothetical protein
MFWSEENADSPLPYGRYPYESTFKVPLLSQRQILAEARQQLEGTGGASQDLELLERLSRRFQEFLVLLASCGRDRPPFVVEDEYDVQIAFDAILRSSLAPTMGSWSAYSCPIDGSGSATLDRVSRLDCGFRNQDDSL